MSTENRTAVPADGKCIQGGAGGARPPVGDATRTLALPQAPYGDAVHTALLAQDLQPDVLEAGLRVSRPTHPELFLRLVWLPGHPALDAPAGTGVTVAWSHVTGWAVHDTDGRSALLDLDVIAAPGLVAAAVRHITARGVDGAARVPHSTGRWKAAHHLDVALSNFEDGAPSWF
ncbi:hypothetical protein AB0M23_32485 [Streptomyces sp. NPDC052077]|uniref:hypothetical protein n=1 Tax=Streptomyces sp. NPDC052077 TaxID=3154757 RepID=UPI003416548B